MLCKVYIICIFLTSTFCRAIQMFAAIQTTEETYFSYLPYLSACSYNQSQFLSGSALITEMNPIQFFTQIQFENIRVFWEPVRNGLGIMVSLPLEINQTNGFILFDSRIINFNRQILLYNINGSSLQLYFTEVSIQIATMKLNTKIKNKVSLQLPQQAAEILQNCPTQNATNFVYLGNSTYLYVCGELQAGFTFVPSSNATNDTKILNFESIGPGQYYLTPNPSIINDPKYLNIFIWNCIILFSNSTQSQLYFMSYDFQSQNYTLEVFASIQPHMNVLIDKIWGAQVKKEAGRWMDMFSQLVSKTNAYFPGEIMSVFVSNHQNIFIESSYNSLNYLCTFNSHMELMWNVSYIGDIFFYGSQVLFIYNSEQNKMYKMEVTRPIYMIQNNASTTPNTFSNFTVQVPCQQQTFTLNYRVLWTSINFPSSLLMQVYSAPIYSTDSVYAFQIEDRFQAVGPDYNLQINAPPNLNVTIIGTSTITLQMQAVSFFNVEMYDGNFASITVVTNNAIYSINSRREMQILTKQPCGFDTISGISEQGGYYYLITNDKGQQCLCNADFTQCGLQLHSFISTSQFCQQSNCANYQQQNGEQHQQFQQQYIKQIEQRTPQYFQQCNLSNTSTQVRKNLYGLLSKGYLVTILTNNSVLLIDILSKQIMDVILLKCPTYNSSDGEIFTKPFYDSSLILYCEQTSSLFQFVVRAGTLYRQREIPLYQFNTRGKGSFIHSGYSFIYIAVDPIADIYPMPDNCCVLRINPTKSTVSAIVEIVNAHQILFVSSYRDIDIALFRSTHDVKSQCIIVAYFPHVWVALNQTNSSLMDSSFPIFIIFESDVYNFAASFQINVTFNLTEVQILLNGTELLIFNELNLNNSMSKHLSPLYSANVSYTFTNLICGPIFYTFFFKSQSPMSSLQVIQNDVLTRTKLLGDIGIQFIQIINPAKYNIVNSTLSALLMAVSVRRMFVFRQQDLIELTNFTLPQRKCIYYLYQLINSTAAEFISDCEGMSENFKSPLLTINYNNVNNVVTYSIREIVLPMAFNQIYTIVRTGNLPTLVLGLLEGPMNSVTGKLYLCNTQYCNPLYVSSRYTFLINYACYTSSNNFVVMSIDYYTLQIYINPEVQPNNTVINSNYTINYTQFVGEAYCSTIRIVNSTLAYSYSVLACASFYYYIRINYLQQTIGIITKFARYSQCDLQDQFQPKVITDTQGNLQVMIATCRQNDYTIKLQSFQTIDSSTPIIYTGFMQIFTLNGPRASPQCLFNSYSPVKIIPLSVSMNYPLFQTYQVGSYHKFIYSEINGFLIDNYVQSQLFVSLQYQPFSLQFDFPIIKFYAINPYQKIIQNITTDYYIGPVKINTSAFLTFAGFALSNLITIICLVCYLCQRKQKQLLLQMRMRESTISNNHETDSLQYDDNIKNMLQSKLEPKIRQRQATNTKRPNRPSEIQMFFVKKK